MSNLRDIVREQRYHRLIKRLGRQKAKQRRFHEGDNNTVVLVKLDGIGDFILFLDAIKGLRTFYKDKRLLLCCSKAVEGIALNTNCFDGIFCFGQEDFFAENIRKTYERIKRLRCDVLLHPTQPRHLFADILCYLIEAKEKIASLGELGGLPREIKEKCDKIYDRLIDQGINNMSLVQSAEFLRGLGYSDYRAHVPTIENVRRVHLFLPNDFFVVFLGGSIYNKLWDPKNYRIIAQYIQQQTGWECILCGDEFDRSQEDAFDKAGETNYFSYIGRTFSIDEVIYIISKAKMVIGNDTSAIHIASALNIPAVCVAGLFANRKFYPYKPEIIDEERFLPSAISYEVDCAGCTMNGCNYSCINGNYYSHSTIRCVAMVSVEEVLRETTIVLSRIMGEEIDEHQ